MAYSKHCMEATPPLPGFDDALALVLRHAAAIAPPPSENIALMDCQGRVLAAPLKADRDQPPFDRSTRDGFAVRAGELSAGPLHIAGSLHAGEAWTQGALAPGSAIEIMTGAAVPAGADAVVMVEHTHAPAKGTIALATGRSIAAGEHIVPTGSEARQGQILIPPGQRLGAAEISLAAACGATRLDVYRKPRVAIVATGDELVELAETPLPQQIRNSNSYALAALVEEAGGEAVRMPIAADTRAALDAAIPGAQDCALLLLSGGVSAGKHDLVEEALAGAGGEFLFTGVRMQPGKPVVFGRIAARGQYFFGLPGNPVSTQVTFLVFARARVAALGGAGVQFPRFAAGVLTDEIRVKRGLTRFLPAVWTPRRERPGVTIITTQGSGDLAANARANCYAVLPEESETVAAGSNVTILLR